MRSPKCRYCAEIVFDRPQKGIGSVTGFTSDSIAELRIFAEIQAGSNRCHVTIMENTAEYPRLKWKKIDEYNLNK